MSDVKPALEHQPVADAPLAYSSADARARAEALDAERAQALTEHADHLAAMTACGSRSGKIMRGKYAELAACRARRAKQWADAYRLLAEDLAELEALADERQAPQPAP